MNAAFKENRKDGDLQESLVLNPDREIRLSQIADDDQEDRVGLTTERERREGDQVEEHVEIELVKMTDQDQSST